MDRAAQELEQLRQLHGWRQRDLSIASLIETEQQRAKQTQRRLGRFIELWLQLVPDELVRETRITGLRAGVVTVEVASASARYELDRRLRSGLFDALQQRYPATLGRVKLKVAR